MKALQEEVDRVQSRADRLEERLTALEVGEQKRTLSVDEDGEVEVRETGRPELKVVKVSRGEEASQAKRASQAASEKDTGPRPVIRATGSSEGRIENLDSTGPSSPARPARDSKPLRQTKPEDKSEGGS